MYYFVAVVSRLDYCNNCLWNMPKKQLVRLQRVQNTAARTVTQTRRSDHVTPIFRELHWLPVETSMDHKILSLVYSCMNGKAPNSLQELIPRYLPVHHLQSSTQSGLCILNVEEGNKNKNSLESEHVSMLHPKLWNSLLITLRQHNSKETAKKNPRTYLFSENHICSDCAFVTLFAG